MVKTDEIQHIIEKIEGFFNENCLEINDIFYNSYPKPVGIHMYRPTMHNFSIFGNFFTFWLELNSLEHLNEEKNWNLKLWNDKIVEIKIEYGTLFQLINKCKEYEKTIKN